MLYLSPSLTEVLGKIQQEVSSCCANFIFVGYEPRDIIGTSSFDWIHPDEVEAARKLH